MRVWTLASWGGLLALTACSGSDQAGPLSTQPIAPEDPVSTPLSATAASRNLQGDTATAQALAKPEIQLNRPQVTRSSRAKTPTLSAPTSARPATPPSSAQRLRARVQQIRQQRTNVSPSPPSRGSQPSLTAVQPVPQPPRPDSAAATASSPAPRTVTSPQPVVTALPPPPRNLDGPVNGGNQRFTQAEVDPPLAPQNPTAATPTPQGQPQEISLNRSAPVPAARHQGYSARTHTPHPVLTPSSPSTAVTTDGSREIAGLRLHGSPSSPPAPTAPSPDAVGLDGPAAPSTNGGDSASGDPAESVTREPATPVTEEKEPAAIAPPATPEVQVQTPDPATVPASYSTEVVPSLNGDHPTPEVLVYQGSPQFSNHLRFDPEPFEPEAKTRPAFSGTKLTPTPQPLTRSRETRSGHQSQGPIRVTAQQVCFPSANQRQTRDETSVPLATRVARLQQKHRQGDAHHGDRCTIFSVTTDKASAQGEAP